MFTRRMLLATSGAALAVPAFAQTAPRGADPFTLGVASGAPRETSVVLWTRLAPDPLNGGGMAPGRVDVAWRVGLDPAFRRTVRSGVTVTSHEKAHSVHVTIDGLEPGREYFYQFSYGDAQSAVGRTRTADARLNEAKIALASCNNYESGHFAAFRDMAEWTPDLVIHVGDYIYEGAAGALGVRTRKIGGRDVAFETVRLHDGPETVTLWDYRNRYALYKTDPHLQAAHAAAPWIVAMDDHEIDNNWAGDIPQDPEKQTPLEFKVRKLAALQAYYEHMPIEKPPVIDGLKAELQMYGAFRIGPALVHLLDTRQYRSDQPCGQGFPGDASCAAMNDPAATMTGAAQEAWLLDSLNRSNAPFNVIASQTWLAPFRYNSMDAPARVNMDQWDGYTVQRQRLIDAMARSSNPVVLSGDWHSAAAMRLHRDPWDTRSARVGHNFCGTSISSHCPWAHDLHNAKAFNPHVDYVDGDKRGYFRAIVSARRWTSQFRTVDAPTQPNSPLSTALDVRTHDL